MEKSISNKNLYTHLKNANTILLVESHTETDF